MRTADIVHDPLPMQAWSVRFYQQACSCGWVSDCYGNDEDAYAEWEDHVEHTHNVIPLFRTP